MPTVLFSAKHGKKTSTQSFWTVDPVNHWTITGKVDFYNPTDWIHEYWSIDCLKQLAVTTNSPFGYEGWEQHWKMKDALDPS
jgi:hypothetical protein